MVDERFSRSLSAVNQVDHPFREFCLVEQLNNLLRGLRYFLRWFDDEGVATGDSIGHKPKGDHSREIEGRDSRADTDGLTNHSFVNAAGNVL